jgi:hypothetical protein
MNATHTERTNFRFHGKLWVFCVFDTVVAATARRARETFLRTPERTSVHDDSLEFLFGSRPVLGYQYCEIGSVLKSCKLAYRR